MWLGGTRASAQTPIRHAGRVRHRFISSEEGWRGALKEPAFEYGARRPRLGFRDWRRGQSALPGGRGGALGDLTGRAFLGRADDRRREAQGIGGLRNPECRQQQENGGREPGFQSRVHLGSVWHKARSGRSRTGVGCGRPPHTILRYDLEARPPWISRRWGGGQQAG